MQLSVLVHPELVDAFQGSDKTDLYYKSKLDFLKDHGFFEESEILNYETNISPDDIKEKIAFTKQIVFEVTALCNLRCKYCIQGDLYEFKKEYRINKTLNRDSAIRLLDYILELKIKYNQRKIYISFYGGEPLLNVDLIKEIVLYLEKYKYEIDINYLMTTNATILAQNIHYLCDNKFGIMISLDGDEYNDSYRKYRSGEGASFKDVIKNIDYVKNKYPKYFDEFVSFNAVLHNRNSVKSICNFIFNRYGKYPKISELSVDNVCLSYKEEFCRIFRNRQKSELEYKKDNNEQSKGYIEYSVIYREVMDFLKFYSLNSFISNLDSLLDENQVVFPTNSCLPFSKKVFLSTDNKIYPCENASRLNEFGQIDGDDVKIDYNNIAKQMSLYYKIFEKSCKHCYINKFCGICMFVKHTCDIDNEEYVCNGFHDEYLYANKLNRIFSYLEENPSDILKILEETVITK